MVRLAALVMLVVALASPALAQRVALVIGNSAYRHVERLANPGNDARAMAAALRPLGFQVELLIDAERSQMETAIRRFGSRAEGAEAALFFYAGHAIEVGGQNMLAPVSAQVRSERDLPFELIGLDLLMSQAEGRARVLLVFLDACRDNPFRGALGAGTRGGASRGLAPPAQSATGTLVAFATAPGTVALDGRGQNSPFTAALLRHLPTAGLEVRSLMGRVRQSVRVETQGRQIPWDSSSLEGEFFFRAGPAIAAAPPVAAAPPPAIAQPPQAVPAVPPPPQARPQQQAARTTNGSAVTRLSCPARGTRTTGRTGFPVTWHGTDPSDPTICISLDGDRTERRRRFAIWDAGNPDSWRFAERLQALFPPAPDKQVEVSRQVNFVQVDETWSWVPAAETPGGEPILQRRIRIRADQPYEGFWRYTLDARTGAITAIAFRHVRGQPYAGTRPSSASLTEALIEGAVDR
jgi:hypothetical protein